MTATADRAAHRAIVRDGPVSAVRSRTTPAPGPGEVLVAPEVVGLCGTDLQMLRGLRDDPSPVVGHEGVARVVAAGDGARLGTGTRVVLNPTHPADPGFLLGHNVDGLFQERVLVPATAVGGGLAVPVGEDLPPDVGALIEPVAVARYALGCVGRIGPETLVVHGDGVIGHLAAILARRVLGPGIRVVLSHGTEHGLRWSREHCPEVDEHVRSGDGIAVRGPAGVVVATPRTSTVGCLEHALDLPVGELAVDLVGGLAPDARSERLPDVELHAVRAANTGGPWPPAVTTVRGPHGQRVHLSGHRGVAGTHLSAAAAELAAEPDTFRRLLTHHRDLDGAAEVMTHLATSADRRIDGRWLIKLAVSIGEDGGNR